MLLPAAGSVPPAAILHQPPPSAGNNKSKSSDALRCQLGLGVTLQRVRLRVAKFELRSTGLGQRRRELKPRVRLCQRAEVSATVSVSVCAPIAADARPPELKVLAQTGLVQRVRLHLRHAASATKFVQRGPESCTSKRYPSCTWHHSFTSAASVLEAAITSSFSKSASVENRGRSISFDPSIQAKTK